MKKLLLSFLMSYAVFSAGYSQCIGDFYDGFESGNVAIWLQGGSMTPAVTTTSPAVGNYRLEGTGGSSTHLQGLYASFPAATPNYISWYVNPTSGTGASSYVVLGNSSVTATNCIAFAYWQGGTNYRFVSSTTYQFPCSPNQWYHIELKNVNFSTHTFDIWIDGVLRQAGFPFRNSTQNDISRVHLYNFNNQQGNWDEIKIGQGNGPVLTYNVNNVLCNGDATGGIDMTTTNGTPTFTYNWSNGATTEDISGVPAGSYTLTVTDNVGCTDSATATITEPSAIQTAATTTDPTCNGGNNGSIDQTISGGTPGYSYSWSNGDTTEDIMGIMAGTYMLTVTDNNGCTQTDSVMVSEPSAVSISATVMAPLCNGDQNGQVFASVTGGTGSSYTYLWSNGSTADSSGMVGAGVYLLTATDSLGCTDSDSITVNEPAVLNANATALDPLCNGESTGEIQPSVTGGSPGYTYLWSNGSTDSTLSAISAGSYTLTLTDANGCTEVTNYTLSDPAAITISSVVTDDNGTGNGAITLTVGGGTGGFTYNWNTGATTQNLSGLTAGTYSVSITDANGCLITGTFIVETTVGISPNQFPLSVSVQPNPFSESFSIHLSELGSMHADLSLVDLQGRIVWEKQQVQSDRIIMEASLPAGAYFLRIQVDGIPKTIKMIRQ